MSNKKTTIQTSLESLLEEVRKQLGMGGPHIKRILVSRETYHEMEQMDGLTSYPALKGIMILYLYPLAITPSPRANELNFMLWRMMGQDSVDADWIIEYE